MPSYRRRDRACLLRTSLLAVAFLLAASPLAAGSSVAKDGVRLLLPNLVPQVPGALFGPQTGPLPSFGYGYPAPPVAIQGCLADEIARKSVERCLRFETIVRNDGVGPFELLFKAEVPAPGAYQVIYDRDGGTRSRFATASEFHPTHNHFHLQGFYEARLWRAEGRRIARSQPAASGEKSGFCPEDGAPSGGGGDARYSCLGDYRTEGMSAGQVVGISAGWSDAYRMHLPDQFIEVSGVPDGRYILEIEIDPADHVVESDESDNRVCVLLRLAGDDAVAIGALPGCR